MLKAQERFKSEKYNIFTEKINKISLISNDDKRILSIHSTETYVYVMSKDLISKKEKIKRNNIIKQNKNVEFWLYCTITLKKKHNLNWFEIPDHP